MSGFINDPLQYINLITDNLSDRYLSGFPVLKELIQNTDDAKASYLDFGLSKGIPESQHPLLQGPALFFINNGEFKPSDARGIRSFGLNSKAADKSSIGKFGLGMKSVFHFCEAFFFLANDGKKEYAEILNPWSANEEVSEEVFHNNWDNFVSKDAELIREYLDSIINSNSSSSTKPPFILWIPLRSKKHLIKDDGEEGFPIIQEYPADDSAHLDFLNEDDLPDQFATLFSFLRYLKQLRYWRQTSTGDFNNQYSIQLGKDAERIQLVDNEDDNTCESHKTHILNGSIEVVIEGNNTTKHEFIGQEKIVWNEKLKQLRGSKIWPESKVRSSQGKALAVPDKAIPHGAVVFSRSTGDGRLTSNWSVFLPLEDKYGETITPHIPFGKHNYHLLLHGYFFIDAGRQGIHGFDDCGSEDTNSKADTTEVLKRQWNCELSKSLVLQQVLPELSHFCEELRLSDEAKTKLSALLNKSQLWKDYAEDITQKTIWIREISAQGLGWKLHNTSQKVLPLSEPPKDDLKRPWLVFPALEKLQENIVFVLHGSPHLSANEGQWGQAQLLNILKSIDVVSVFKSQKLVSYLAGFISGMHPPELGALDVQKQLRELLRYALKTHGVGVLRENKASINELISVLNQDSYINIGKGYDKDLITAISSIKTDILLFPDDFDVKKSKGQSGLEDASNLLKAASDFLKSNSSGRGQIELDTFKLAGEIISKVQQEDISKLLIRCDDLRIWEAYDCKRQAKVAVSLLDIRKAKERAVLFGYSQGATSEQRLGFSLKLQKVLFNERILILSSKTVKLVNTTGVQACDAARVLQCIGSTERELGDISARLGLIKVVSGSLDSSSPIEHVKGFRYLLHGTKEYFSDTNKSLWILGHRQHPVWEKLWAFTVDEEEPWNLIDQKLADTLPRGIWDVLNIKEIHSNTILEELKQEDIEFSLQHFSPTEDESTEISVTIISNNDEDLWLQMPIHQTIDEQFISVNHGNVYLETEGVELDKSLLKNISIIKRSSHPTISKRQASWLQPIDDVAKIKIALGADNPEKHWQLIMDSLEVFKDDVYALEYLNNVLKKTKWLPTQSGSVFSPEDTIALDSAQSEIEQIIAQESDIYTSDTLLVKELRKHNAYKFLRKNYLAYGETGIQQLALLVSELSHFHIGNIELTSSDEFKTVVDVLSESELQGWKLLGYLQSKYLEESYTHLLPVLKRSLSIDTVIQLMNWVSDSKKASKEIQFTFNKYLTLFSKDSDVKENLSQLKLLNQSSKWKSTSGLTADASGISSNYLLNKDQESVLLNKGVIDEVNHLGSQTENDNSTGQVLSGDSVSTISMIKDYFVKWLDQGVSESFIGAIALLLGRESGVKELVDSYTSQSISREWLVDNIPWQRPDQILAYSGVKGGKWLNEESFDDALSKISLVLHTIDEKEVTVRSLLNEELKVPLDNDFKHLLVGRTERYYKEDQSGGYYQVYLGLREIDVESYPEEELLSFVKNYLEYVLEVAYKQRSLNLDSLWSELEGSDQIAIDIARSLILQNIPFYLKQLRVHKHEELQKYLDKYQQENKNALLYKGKEKEKSFIQNKEQALVELQNFIVDNSEVKNLILEALREKVRDFQYSPESIPFEMFQNADDALYDLEKIKSYPQESNENSNGVLPNYICKFVIYVEYNQVTFMHWGRPINWTGGNNFPGKDYQFGNDLENMLVLSASDKAEGATGKFGLGYKSVLLAADESYIVSGRIQTKIEAGLLPLPLNDVGSIRKNLREIQSDLQYPGTAICLPLTECSSEDLLARFKQVVGVLPAFAKNIQEVVLQTSEYETMTASWIGTELTQSIEVGDIRLNKNNGFVAMKFTSPVGSLLFALNTNGFDNLSTEIPNFWVTAPVQESEKIGFAINADFSIDAGRLRLAADIEPNIDLMKQLGRSWGKQLSDLVSVVENDWDKCLKLLKLSPKVTSYIFWESFFQSTMKRVSGLPKESPIYQLTINLLQSALSELLENKQIIPNGLSSNQSLLLCSDIKYVLKSALLESDIFSMVDKTQVFKGCISRDKSIIDNNFKWVADLVPKLRKIKDQWQSVTLTSVISNSTIKEITPDDANILYQLVEFEERDNFEKISKISSDDFEKAKKEFSQFVFLNAEESWVKAESLLSNSSDEEELRFIFAPEKYQLSSSYSVKATSFFKFCRGHMNAPTEQLAKWIIDAQDDAKKQASLKYLVSGELGSKVAEKILEIGIESSWLNTLEEGSSYLSYLSEEEINKLLYKLLKTPEESKQQWTKPEQPNDVPEVSKSLDPKFALNAIYEWWIEEKHEYISDYQNSIYPDFIDLNFSMNDFGEIDRSSWLVILLLGGFHTLGRTHPQQHRNFISTCKRKGWWDVFVNENIETNFNEWMNILDEFFDEQIDSQEYEQWMMRFPVIYKLSRHLEAYSNTFMELHKHKSSFNLQGVLSSRADSAQQGGGISAPALGKTLGMGTNFIIRELLRHKAVILTPHVLEHAFVPYSSIRQLLMSMGCNSFEQLGSFESSKQIFNFLNQNMDKTKMAFDNDFDIPLRIIAEDESLQLKLFNSELMEECV